ncbi:MAG: HD domain-containing protein [Rhizobium sp.]|nr:HD domain-containing protein [Rhizobium sp.]
MAHLSAYLPWCGGLDDRSALVSEAMRLHDAQTLGHCARVSAISLCLGRLLGHAGRTLDTLMKAGLLHDVGKLSIDQKLLNAPRGFTPEERALVRLHPQHGFDLLEIADHEQFQEVSLIVLQHHEQWDGHGYPHAMAGKDQHPLARLLAVADVFDALSSPRAYKPGWHEARIRDHFARQRGCQFDPEMVDLLLDNYAPCVAAREGVPDIPPAW